jgi:hypothetical protein
MPIKTYGTDSTLRQQRKAIHAFWFAHPEATGKQAATALGVSVYTAMSNRPHGLPPADRSGDHKRGIRPDAANAEALRLYEMDLPLAEIAEATGRSITTTRRFLRAHTKANP